MSHLDDQLRAELADLAPKKKTSTYNRRQERIIAGFEDIQRFVQEHGRIPEDGAEGDIFERLYAVRLQRLRELQDCRELLLPLDHQGLLKIEQGRLESEDLDDEALLAELKANAGTGIAELKHVRPMAEIRAAEEIAERARCKDFSRFQPLFEKVAEELATDVRQSSRFERDASIAQGDFFILDGLTVYVAEVGEFFRGSNGGRDARLRVIFSNGTESNLLMRSLQRALYKDESGRRIGDPGAGPLFVTESPADYAESGTIYVLRSHSNDPYIAAHRELVHKIGVTGGKVETRIANAEHEATYLLAPVEIVATYKLLNINRTRLEKLLHRFFSRARLEVTIKDRFNNPVEPREWFLVPLFAIDEAVSRIKEGTITDFIYDPKTAKLVEVV